MYSECKCNVNAKFNVKHRECMCNHPSQRLMIECLTIPDQIGIWKCWFLRRGENQSTQRKTSRSKEENQQQTQPTYDGGSRNLTRDTLVGGKRSHHCVIPAPQNGRLINKNKLSSLINLIIKEFKINNLSLITTII